MGVAMVMALLKAIYLILIICVTSYEVVLNHYLPHPPPPIGGGEGPLPWLTLPILRGPPGPGL